MGFVAHLLEEVLLRAAIGQRDRVLLAGQEDALDGAALFALLREAGHREPPDAAVAHLGVSFGLRGLDGGDTANAHGPIGRSASDRSL